MSRAAAIVDTNVVVAGLLTGNKALQRDAAMRARALSSQAFIES